MLIYCEAPKRPFFPYRRCVNNHNYFVYLLKTRSDAVEHPIQEPHHRPDNGQRLRLSYWTARPDNAAAL